MAIPTTHEQIIARREADQLRADMITSIINALMLEDQKRLAKMRFDIIEEHNNLTRTDGFYHGGQFHSNIRGVPQVSLQKLPIHDSLRERWHLYMSQQIDWERDKAKILQGLAVMLSGATTDQDIRDNLPEVLVPLAKEGLLATLKRTKPEGHTLKTPMLMKQNEALMDKVFFYLGSRLLG